MSPRIPIDRDKVAEFCRRRHIRKLSLFGSVLRDDFRADSDVDVLVELEPGHPVGLFALVAMEQELSALLQTPKVDLVLQNALNRWIRQQVLAEAEVQYVEER